MSKEQSQTLKGLQTAIQMEIDGKEFYSKASRESGNPAGAKLLATLAVEEDKHRKKFVQIYESLNAKKEWPRIAPEKNAVRELQNIMTQGIRELKGNKKALKTEIDAVKTAIDMEVKTYDYYREQSKKAQFPGEKEFYNAIAGEERQHQLVLLDYYEYCKDPAAWFVKTEKPSLDGG